MTESPLSGKRVVVVGLGASGVAACRLLWARKARVRGVDAGAVVPDAASGLATEGMEVLAGGHDERVFDDAHLIVVSPGVPSFPALAAAEARGVPVISEIELAFRELRAKVPIVAIGGTNGKSTTTALVGAILAHAGKRVFIGGNFGDPWSTAVTADAPPYDVFVLEVSSFQMERVPTFRPRVAALLNVTPDHLDRYESLETYAAAKGNAFANQLDTDFAVAPEGDERCLAQARRGKGALTTFGPGGDVDVHARAVVDKSVPVAYDAAEFALRGGHNMLNVAAAIAAVRPFRIKPAVILESLRSFRGLPHRMALVRKVAGVTYYDDSKGTNVDAAVTAVRGVPESRVVLICGGRDKGGSYGPLAHALREKGRAAVVIGEAAEAIAFTLGATLPVRRATSMDDAVELAAQLAEPGDAVLLSPACSSFDMFRDYKDRGDAFVRSVLSLPGESQA